MDDREGLDIVLIQDRMQAFLPPIDRRHTERVAELCEAFLAENPSVPVDGVLLLEAAWIHDVAKTAAGKKHAEPKYVKDALREAYPELVASSADTEEFYRLLVIVSAHKGEFAPPCCALESAVLRMCDKLDKYDKAKDQYLTAKLAHLRTKDLYNKKNRRVWAKDECDKAERKLLREPASTVESCAENLYRIESSGLLTAEEFHAVERFTLEKLRRL